MALITVSQLSLAYGHWPLLDHVDFSLEANERVGLIGRNGTGKSSLLKVLAGLAHADDGEIVLRQSLRVAYVAQEPLLNDVQSVFDAVSKGVARARALRAQVESGDAAHDDHAEIHRELDALDGWNWEQRVDVTLTHLQLNAQARVGDLSGGQKKRVALAQALVAQPEVLLLDEPTNHLDLDSIAWLEALLLKFRGAIILITHDRQFLDNVATRIVELDRGKLLSFDGNYAAYEQQKAEQRAFEATVNAKADKLLAEEEVWIRKGVEARRTRNENRIVRLEAMRAQRRERRNTLGQIKLDIDAGARSGKLVAELTDVDKSFDRTVIAKGINLTVLRGDKLALIGSNGAGKTTLLKMILGELAPDSGKVRTGTQLAVAYFDQLRNTLALDATLAEFISPGSDWIEIGGKRKHVMSYLGDFLFSPQRANSPVATLSGGERNRLLLARLFARPANVLVLDEPTNDLDIDTLELLEQLLIDYAGTVLLVSHDRRFLDNVVTSCFVAEGDGIWKEYEGGVTDWQAQRAVMAAQLPIATNSSKSESRDDPINKSVAVPSATRTKLSFNEKRELDRLPNEIDALEKEQTQINATLAAGDIYRSDASAANALAARLLDIDAMLMEKMTRWEALATRA